MKNPLLNELSVREKDREYLENYLVEMDRILGPDTVSIMLYGSVVKDNYFPGASDINILFVVNEMNAEVLKKSSPVIKRYESRCKISTFLVDTDDIKDSSDVFPIIYLDMKEHHMILKGDDIFSDMYINPFNLRFDLERQLREVLLELRREFIHSNYTAAELRSIIVSSFSSFSRLLSAMIYLKGIEPPLKKADIVREASKIFDFEAGPMCEILSLKTGGNNPLKQELHILFEKYLDIVEKAVEIIDKTTMKYKI